MRRNRKYRQGHARCQPIPILGHSQNALGPLYERAGRLKPIQLQVAFDQRWQQVNLHGDGAPLPAELLLRPQQLFGSLGLASI